MAAGVPDGAISGSRCVPEPSSPLIVPVLRSARLVLEPLSTAHADGMFAMWSHAEVCRYAGAAFDLGGAPIRLPAETRADSDKIIDFFVAGAASGTRFRWALLTLPDRVFAGAAGFNALGPCAEYAYHLDPRFQGRGLMTEASRLAFDWLRARAGCREVEAFIEPVNAASIRLARRLGLQATGILHDGAERHAMIFEEA